MDAIKTTSVTSLTQFSRGSGCGCKIAPAVLDEIISGSSSKRFPGLLVGNESRDDAAVLEMADGSCLVSTTDFFTPVVDDAFDFGRIAAVNAISDIYAMGAQPLLAVAILGWPVDKLPAALAREVINGARVICEEAGIPLAGGHSIDITEPVFGLAVNGTVVKSNLKRNDTAQQGDLLFLTKPLGTGILSAALKRGKITGPDLEMMVTVMTALNKAGTALGKMKGVHALTDVTGFGLLGHLVEMAEGSRLSAVINYKDVPLINGIEKYTNEMIFPDSVYRNWNGYQQKVKGVNASFITLCDPQTSGGLLAAVHPDAANEFLEMVRSFGVVMDEKPIGKMVAKKETVVEVVE